jgi:hypothetical protein
MRVAVAGMALTGVSNYLGLVNLRNLTGDVKVQRRPGLHFPHNLRLSLWIKRVFSVQSVIYQGVHDNAYFLGGK